MSTPPEYTFRDARLYSRVLNAANAVGRGLRRVGIEKPALTPTALIAAARKQTGLTDLGSDGVHEALEVLCDAMKREASLSTFGRIVMRGLLGGALENRLRLLDWAKRHPEVREERIESPIIVVGLPRTGTTLLSLLLSLDPAVRPLLQWEASKPIPPPDLASHAEDPRIGESARTFEQLVALNPPIRAMHPFGATLATECVTLLIFDLRALSIETQAFVPSYGRWLEDTDMRDAYALHRLGLQVLQSRIPTLTWSLKTPNHLWCLDTLLATYPDARIVWTHRDPSKVIPSVASLNTALLRANAESVDPMAVGRDWNRKLHLAVTRGIAFDRGQEGRPWCHHLQYADLMRDPIAAVRNLYAHFGLELHPLHERRMQVWMNDRPQEHFGRHRYDGADFGFSREGLSEQYADYRERFAVPSES